MGRKSIKIKADDHIEAAHCNRFLLSLYSTFLSYSTFFLPRSLYIHILHLDCSYLCIYLNACIPA